MRPTVQLLRGLIAATVVLTVASVVADMFWKQSLPEPVRDLLDAEDERSMTSLDVVLLNAVLILLLACAVSLAGLWKLWRPARWLYTLVLLIGPLFYFAFDSFAWFTPAGAFFNDFLMLLGGAILALIWCSDLSVHFQKSNKPADAPTPPLI